MIAEANHGHEEGSKLYVMVWLGLLLLTAVEVVLAYVQMFSTEGMLAILMFLSLIKAAMIVARLSPDPRGKQRERPPQGLVD